MAAPVISRSSRLRKPRVRRAASALGILGAGGFVVGWTLGAPGQPPR